MENALAVANYFVDKAISESVELTPMKLVKLVYISHGWNLAIFDNSLFEEDIQAWKYGPVVVTVYLKYRHYGSGQIVEKEPQSYNTDSGKFRIGGVFPEISNSNTSQLLNRVWDQYKKYDGIQLSSMTHKSGTPWDIAYNKLGGKHVQSFPIPNELIRTYYINLINERRKNEA